MDKVWYVHKIGYYSAIKMNEVLLDTTLWMGLKNMIQLKQCRHKAHIQSGAKVGSWL